MKWYAVAAVALVLLVLYAYYTVGKQAEMARVVDDIKLYMAKLETLKRDVATKEELQQRGEALDKAAENLKTKEGELKGKYGDMTARQRREFRDSSQERELLKHAAADRRRVVPDKNPPYPQAPSCEGAQGIPRGPRFCRAS